MSVKTGLLHGLGVPENKMLREDKDEDKIELCNEDIHNLCPSYKLLWRPNQAERDMRGGDKKCIHSFYQKNLK
jgi:hypothetical protein